MRYIKNIETEVIFVWTEALAKREDMVEIIPETKAADVDTTPDIPPPSDTPDTPDTSDYEPLPAFRLKSAGFGRWYVVSDKGNKMSEAISREDAEAKLAELSA